MFPETLFVTEIGYQNLLSRIAEKTKEYEEVCNHRQVAFELSGDGWHDNPEFNRMQQLEANLNHTLKNLNDQLSSLKLIEINDAMRNTKNVAIGSIVKISRYDLNRDQEYYEIWEIRGLDETDINKRYLAYNAPLASKILGLEVGDIVEEMKIATDLFDIEVVCLYKSRLDAGLENN